MARVCTVCSHPKLLNIDRQLLRGDRLKKIAHRFHLSEDAVGRHRRHMRTALLKAEAAAEKPDLVYPQTLIDEAKTALRITGWFRILCIDSFVSFVFQCKSQVLSLKKLA